MSGAIYRQPSPPTHVAASSARDSLVLAVGFLGFILGVDVCLANGLSGQRWPTGQDLASLACLVVQTAFLSLLVRRALPSPAIATLVFMGNFLLVSSVAAIYSAGHPSHNRFASAFLAGQFAFLAIWLALGEQSLGARALGTCAGAGLLLVGWYGYAARRSTADCNLIWMSQTLAVLAAAMLLRLAGFRLRRIANAAGEAASEQRGSRTGEAQVGLKHLMAGLFVVSCLLGLARLLGVMKPTYFADLIASELNAAVIRRGVGVGLATSLAVAFAAHSVLLRTNIVARYLPALVYVVAMGYAIHLWGPPHVEAIYFLNRPTLYPAQYSNWIPTTSQWPIWMLLNAGLAMGGTMFLHALGYRLTRHQPAARVATKAR